MLLLQFVVYNCFNVLLQNFDCCYQRHLVQINVELFSTNHTSVISLTLLTFCWREGSRVSTAITMLTIVMLCLKIPIVCCFDIYIYILNAIAGRGCVVMLCKSNTDRHLHCTWPQEKLIKHADSRRQWNNGSPGINTLKTRMYSSRMRIDRCSGHH